MESLLEKNVKAMTEKLFGDKDDTLKELVGMSSTGNINEDILEQLKRNNILEKEYIDKELLLTLDKQGEIQTLSSHSSTPEFSASAPSPTPPFLQEAVVNSSK